MQCNAYPIHILISWSFNEACLLIITCDVFDSIALTLTTIDPVVDKRACELDVGIGVFDACCCPRCCNWEMNDRECALVVVMVGVISMYVECCDAMRDYLWFYVRRFGRLVTV